MQAQQVDPPVALQHSEHLTSGNRVTFHVDREGEITEQYQQNPSKADRAEAERLLPAALGEAGLKLMEPEAKKR